MALDDGVVENQLGYRRVNGGGETVYRSMKVRGQEVVVEEAGIRHRRRASL